MTVYQEIPVVPMRYQSECDFIIVRLDCVSDRICEASVRIQVVVDLL